MKQSGKHAPIAESCPGGGEPVSVNPVLPMRAGKSYGHE